MVALTKSQNKWGFASGRVSALAGRLMPYDYFVGLAGLERVEDMFHRLQDSSLREHMVPGAITWEDWSTIIDTYLDGLIASLRRDCPTPALADLFALSEDYLNLKRAVLNRSPFPFEHSLFSEARLNEVAEGNTSLLPDTVRPAVASLMRMGAAAGDALAVDLVLDSAYLRHYLALAKQVGAPLIVAWATERVLGRAVSVLWRTLRAGKGTKEFRELFMPIEGLNSVLESLVESPEPRTWGGLIPGRTGELFRAALEYPEDEQPAKFDQFTCNYLTEAARTTKLQTAGPERVAGYLWGVWVESFNMKLVISGKLNRIDADALKGRVRETYV